MSSFLNRLSYRPGSNAEVLYARSKPTYVSAMLLLAGAESILDVPQGAAVCIFSSDSDFYARPDATAILPLEDITDGTAPELNPAQWDVHDIAQLHLIAPEDTALTLSFYQ